MSDFNFFCIDGQLCNELHAFQRKKSSHEYRSYAAAVPGLFVHDRYLLYFEVRQLNQQPYRYDSGVLRCIRTVAKGFFDTIPTSLREAAYLEGASEARTFFTIVLPLSKPIIVYTVISSFLVPWTDFVFAKIILNSGISTDWTVAIGLYNMLNRTLIPTYFSRFCAGGVMVGIPIGILFIIMQKFYVEGITGGSVKG